MAVVKINALQIPPQAGEEVVKRFTARLDELSRVAGFEGFELLRPTGEAEPRWFVYTRWADEASFQAWRNSETFAHSHAGGGPGAGHPGRPGEGGESGEGDQADQAGEGGGPGGHGGGGGHGDGPRPVAMGATLLEFEVAVTAGPAEG